jgi:hypothetical protein
MCQLSYEVLGVVSIFAEFDSMLAIIKSLDLKPKAVN